VQTDDGVTRERLLELVRRATGQEPDGRPVVRLAGHASLRTYWRVGELGTGSVVVMVLPQSAPAEEIGRGGTSGPAPFVDVQGYLQRIGVRVPAVHGWSQEEGWVVLEDLGDEMMVNRLDAGAPAEPLYAEAVTRLAHMRVAAERAPDPGCIAFSRAFDGDLYRWELGHFLEWGLEARGIELSAAERKVVDHHFEAIVDRLESEPRGFTHRDYQSRNLMVLPDGSQVVIDFQDALLGPREYDLVALLRDSYVQLDQTFIDGMIRRYIDETAALGGPAMDFDRCREVFDLLTVQRKLKDAGRFVYIDRVKGNPGFLPFVPRALARVREAFARQPALAELQDVLAPHVPELAVSAEPSAPAEAGLPGPSCE
jgi:aminoglycoside/choline kinase family phosphotransferase